MGGWIKLYRELTSWEWFRNPKMVQLFIWLLLRANPNDDSRNCGVKRGQLVTTAKAIMEGTGLSYQELRTCIARLVATNKITKESTNKYSIITICDYDSYRGSFLVEQPTKQPTKQPTDQNQAKTNQPTNQQSNQQKLIITDCSADSCSQQPTDKQPISQPTSNQQINQQNSVVTDCGRADCDKRLTDQQPTKQPTNGYINNNNINNIISTTTTTTAPARVREDEFIAEMKKEELWLEAMAKNFGYDKPTIISRLDEFRLDIDCRAVAHRDLGDARRHFNDWLRKRKSSETAIRGRVDNKSINDIWQ